MINTLLSCQKAKTIKIYKKDALTKNATTGLFNPATYTLYKTVTGLYYKVSGSKTNISEKFKEQVTASILVDPLILTEQEMETDMKINVSDEGDYILVYADDIAGQGKVLQLNVKELE